MDDEGIAARTLKAFKEKSGFSWKQVSEELQVSLRVLVPMRDETKWSSFRALKKVARYFQWSNEEFGLALYHVPRNLPKKRKRGSHHEGTETARLRQGQLDPPADALRSP